MNLVELIIYNSFSSLTVPQDSEVLQERLIEYKDQFKYPIGIVTEQILSIMKDKYIKKEVSFNNMQNFLNQIDPILYKQLYNSNEQAIITGFHLIWCLSFPPSMEAQLITYFENLINLSSSKEEIIYCLEEIKYRLLSYYVVHGINQQRINELIEELEPIEERHNSMEIFGLKENVGN